MQQKVEHQQSGIKIKAVSVECHRKWKELYKSLNCTHFTNEETGLKSKAP